MQPRGERPRTLAAARTGPSVNMPPPRTSLTRVHLPPGSPRLDQSWLSWNGKSLNPSPPPLPLPPLPGVLGLLRVLGSRVRVPAAAHDAEGQGGGRQGGVGYWGEGRVTGRGLGGVSKGVRVGGAGRAPSPASSMRTSTHPCCTALVSPACVSNPSSTGMAAAQGACCAVASPCPLPPVRPLVALPPLPAPLQVVERFTAHYVFALGLSRFLSCAHWILQVGLRGLAGGWRGRAKAVCGLVLLPLAASTCCWWWTTNTRPRQLNSLMYQCYTTAPGYAFTS